MSLHWIFGGSGFGKSHYVYNRIMQQASDDKAGRYIVIVPEQFTMQTQKDMVMMSKDKGIMNIDVLSFVRLAYRVFEETDVLSKPLLEDEGKSMVIKRILKEHAAEWKTFGSNINRLGFVEEIKSIITEFVQYRVDDEKLEAMKMGVDGKRILSAKLEDLKLVYEYYQKYMQDRYISSEELLSILADYVTDAAILKDSILCIDGFTGFTPVQYELLTELMKVCKDIYITVTIDRDTDPYSKIKPDELFCMSKKYISKCNEIAMKAGVLIEEPVWTGCDEHKGWRFVNNTELAALEKNIFRNKRPEATIETNENIRIYEASDSAKEVEYCVWQICNLIKNKGLRYRDIAIITADVELYARLFKSEFAKVNIPVFADTNRNILDNQFVSLLMAILSLVKYDYDYQSVMTLLRNGIVRDYLAFENMETDALDTYLVACGIRGKSMWQKEWRSNKRIAVDIEIVNDTRQRVIDIFGEISDRLKQSKNVLDYCRVLYDFMIEWNMSDVVKKEALRCEAEGDFVAKKENEQIYRIVINLIDQLTELMGEEIIDLREFVELVKLGFSEASVGVIPPGVDNIIVGDITRTRLKDIKILFFVGVNEGVVPKTIKSGGFLSDMERELLSESGAELAPTLRERIFNERFYIYLALTRPSDKLFISYCKKGSGMGELQPSPIIADIEELYGEGYRVDSGYGAWNIDARLGNDSGMTWWIEGLRKYAGAKEDAATDKEWLMLHKEKAGKTEYAAMLDSAFYDGGTTPLTQTLAKRLYGDNLEGSVSRLELYASCAYAHFLRYGLLLSDRKEYTLNVPDMGTIFHKVIEEFALRLEHTGKLWQNVEKEDIENWTKQITEHTCNEFGHGILNGDARNMYIKNRITRIASATIENLCEQMKKGKFRAESYEVRFSVGEDTFTFPLKNGSVMKLSGRMDRLDTYEDDEKVLYKIIDYKSGKPSFDLLKLYHGINMQLVVYLMAAKDIEKQIHPDKLVIPAGTFYYHIDDPVVDEELTDEEADIERKIKKMHRMSGPTNSDNQIPCFIDHDLGNAENGLMPNADSDVINVKVGTNGTYNKRSELYNTEQFEYMMEHTRAKIQEFGSDICEGNIEARPYKLDKNTPCEYCEYKSICRFDSRLSGNDYNKLKEINEEEIWKEWEELYGE